MVPFLVEARHLVTEPFDVAVAQAGGFHQVGEQGRQRARAESVGYSLENVQSSMK